MYFGDGCIGNRCYRAVINHRLGNVKSKFLLHLIDHGFQNYKQY
jgi:hypothetical protein